MSDDALGDSKHGKMTKKEEIIKKNDEYLELHPEVRIIMRDFLDSVLHDKPDRMYSYCKTFFDDYLQPKRGIVICGPSGVGKGTVIKQLFKELPSCLGFSVSHTTRSPRPGEVNGKDYNFVSREEFQKLIDEDKFIEHAEYNGNCYGTSIMSYENVAESGKICVIEIEIEGAKSLKTSDKFKIPPYFVFISPPTEEELEKRLRGRGTEEEDVIQGRLERAKEEIKYGETHGNFDYNLINVDIDSSVERLKKQIYEWFPETMRR